MIVGRFEALQPRTLAVEVLPAASIHLVAV